MPKMTHPDSTKILDVADEQVAMYESQGWSKAPPKSKS